MFGKQKTRAHPRTFWAWCDSVWKLPLEKWFVINYVLPLQLNEEAELVILVSNACSALGIQSPFYIDLRRLISNPDLLLVKPSIVKEKASCKYPYLPYCAPSLLRSVYMMLSSICNLTWFVEFPMERFALVRWILFLVLLPTSANFWLSVTRTQHWKKSPYTTSW